MARFIFVTGGVVSSLGKGLAVRVPRGAPAGARLQGPDPQVRSLSQRRSGDDDALSARRGLRHRRRRRDRPRPRPLRAFHGCFGETVGQCDDRAHLPRHHRQGTARRLSRRDRPGDPARYQRNQGVRARRHRRARLRHLRDRRDGGRHREPAVHRIDSATAGTTSAATRRSASTPRWCRGSPRRASSRPSRPSNRCASCRASASSPKFCCAAATGLCPRPSARRLPCSATSARRR